MNDNILTISEIEKSFSGTPVLRDISLSVERGEFITLLGASGCGKTTTLRIIAGLEMPDSGAVILEGVDVTHTAPNKRNVNTVFQSYALFPHMNVEANIGYSLRIQRRPKKEIKEEVEKMLDLVQLPGYEKRMPGELSGGQRQRVAIARAVISHPKLLLLDEPLGALDLQLRRQMQTELKRLQKKLGITFIYITHDQEEALNMSDRIVVMKEGRFEQIGTPSEVYDLPKTAYVARFVGTANIISGKVTKAEGDIVSFEGPAGRGSFHSRGAWYQSGDPVTLALRGEQTSLGRADPVQAVADPCQGLRGVVREKNFSGGMLRVAVELENGEEFVCNRHGLDFDISPGSRVTITWQPEHAIPVEPESEAEL